MLAQAAGASREPVTRGPFTMLYGLEQGIDESLEVYEGRASYYYHAGGAYIAPFAMCAITSACDHVLHKVVEHRRRRFYCRRRGGLVLRTLGRTHSDEKRRDVCATRVRLPEG